MERGNSSDSELSLNDRETMQFSTRIRIFSLWPWYLLISASFVKKFSGMTVASGKIFKASSHVNFSIANLPPDAHVLT